MRSTWILLATLVPILPAVAAGWTPDPAEDRWVASIVEDLDQSGETPNTAHRFSKSVADYSIDGEKVARDIFVLRDNPDVILIVNSSNPNEGEFVADFGSKKVNAHAFRGVYSSRIPRDWPS